MISLQKSQSSVLNSSFTSMESGSIPQLYLRFILNCETVFWNRNRGDYSLWSTQLQSTFQQFQRLQGITFIKIGFDRENNKDDHWQTEINWWSKFFSSLSTLCQKVANSSRNWKRMRLSHLWMDDSTKPQSPSKRDLIYLLSHISSITDSAASPWLVLTTKNKQVAFIQQLIRIGSLTLNWIKKERKSIYVLSGAVQFLWGLRQIPLKILHLQINTKQWNTARLTENIKHETKLKQQLFCGERVISLRLLSLVQCWVCKQY